jgi:exonuclease III
MNILSWNCWGLGNPTAVLALHNLVKVQGPKVLFLMETKLDGKKMEVLRVELHFKFCFTVLSRGSSGGLALLWNDPVELTIQNYTQNHIEAHVQVLPSQLWRFTGFYGHPKGHRHRESWALLNKLNGMDQLPRLCMGDFNEILFVDERTGEVLVMYGKMEDINEVVNRCGLLDMGFRGVPFT